MDIKFHCSEKSNFPEGLQVRAFTYKEYSIEMHNHDFYEVNIVLAGRGTHCIENGRFLAKRGDVFVIPPMVAHAYEDTEGLEVYHILLQKGFLYENWVEAQRVKGFLRLIEIEPFLRGNFLNAFFLHLTHGDLILLDGDLSVVDDYGDFSWEDHAVMKYHTTWKILYWFSALLSQQLESEERKTEHKYEMQIIKILEFMHLHYDEKITIDRLCKETYLSRPTFLRSFKSISGANPIEYLNHYRYKKALEMLDTTDWSKTEIAHRCGFYDLSHMERMMKKARSRCGTR